MRIETHRRNHARFLQRPSACKSDTVHAQLDVTIHTPRPLTFAMPALRFLPHLWWPRRSLSAAATCPLLLAIVGWGCNPQALLDLAPRRWQPEARPGRTATRYALLKWPKMPRTSPCSEEHGDWDQHAIHEHSDLNFVRSSLHLRPSSRRLLILHPAQAQCVFSSCSCPFRERHNEPPPSTAATFGRKTCRRRRRQARAC
jgi:hypothetical protein